MPPELDQMNPDAQNSIAPDMSAQADTLPSGETDREGAMAKADLYKLANYSHKLFQQIDDNDQLEGWVQAKITKAADYVASVYHYLEYEMKFSNYGKALDDSDVLSEGQKRVLKTRLMEAKSKVKELKKAQAEKVKDKRVAEGAISGGHTACAECGGSGMVYEEPKAIPDHVKAKVAKYKRQATAFHAAGKRIDANKNGIPDDEEFEEDFDSLKKTGDSTKTSKGNTVTKTDKGIEHKRPSSSYSDEDGEEKSGKGAKSHAKAKTSADKAGDRAMDKAQEKDYKAAKKADPEGVRRYSLGKQTDAPGQKKEKEVDETYGKGVYEASKLKGNQKRLDADKDGDIEADDLADLRAGKKVKESAKPSAGLSAEKKSAVVKKAKAGGDIGKPGKGFAKVEKAAAKSGAKDPKAVAAAAMWKNIKEGVKVVEAEKKAKKDYDKDGEIETGAEEHAGSVDKAIKASKEKETVKESADMTRMKEFLTRLNG
jgi:hypothetical protein